MTGKAGSTSRPRRGRDAPPAAQHDARAQEQVDVEAARRGDLRAWYVLTRRHQELVFRSAYLATRDSGAAEEVTKSTFMRAYRSLLALDGSVEIRPWLMGIAATVARSHLRELSLRRDAKMADPDPCPRLPASPPVLVAGSLRPTPMEHDALVAAVDGLFDEDRVVIASRYGFSLTRDEAAVRLSIPPDRVEERLGTSMRRLRARVADTMATVVAPLSGGPSGERSSASVSRLALLGDDELGSIAMAAMFSDLRWTPDVAAVVCARLDREAVAYPPQLMTRPSSGGSSAHSVPSPARTVSGADVAVAVPVARSGGRTLAAVAAVAVLTGILSLTLVGTDSGRDVTADLGARVGALLDGAGVRTATIEAAGRQVDQPVTDGADLDLVVPVVSTGVAQEAVQSALGSSLPEFSVVAARVKRDGDVVARVAVDWRAGEALRATDPMRLERQNPKGAWRSIDPTDAGGVLEAVITGGKRYLFRVSATDEAGSAVVSPTVALEVAVRGPRSKHLRLARNGWITRRGKINDRLIARSADASISTQFRGTGVALIGPTGPTRGAIGVSLDGGPWAQEDLRTRTDSPRAVVFSQQLGPGRHALDLRAEAVGLGVDAILIVRTPKA